MGEKDISEKVLEDYNDVFSDIVNVLLFHGDQLVKENELENIKDKSQYKADGRLHEQERDVAKIWHKGDQDCRIRIALFGIENQTDIDSDMVFRVLGYDGTGYRRQLLKKEPEKERDSKTSKKKALTTKKTVEKSGKSNDSKRTKNTSLKEERYPVITLVLYFGYTKHWKKRTLYEVMDIPEELKPYVNDYRINVFEIAWLTDEQVQMFRSDFKIVADYFVQMRKNRHYKASAETIQHVDEVFKMMKALAKNIDFEKEINRKIIEKRKQEVATMKGFFDDAIAEGKIEGEKKLLINQIYKKMLKEQKPEEIADMLEEEVADIQPIYDLIQESLPEFDADRIFEKLSAEAVKEPA